MMNNGTAWCATKLLAKDGVWLDVAPRDLRGLGKKPTPIQLGPGNRADIAIACTCPFPELGCYSEFYSMQNCTEEAISIMESDEQVDGYNAGEHTPVDYTPCQPQSSRRRRGCEGIPRTPMVDVAGPLSPPKCGYGRKPVQIGKHQNGPGLGHPQENTHYASRTHNLEHGLLDAFNGTVFSIVVEPTSEPRKFWHPAWKFSVRRPCYLVDMRKAVVEPEHMRHVEFYGAIFPEPILRTKAGPIAVMYDELAADIPSNPRNLTPQGNVKFNDRPLPEPYGTTLPMGTAVEWLVGGLAFHPFHLHVTPFQIQNITGTPDLWLQDGDWQDT